MLTALLHLCAADVLKHLLPNTEGTSQAPKNPNSLSEVPFFIQILFYPILPVVASWHDDLFSFNKHNAKKKETKITPKRLGQVL